LVIDDEPFLRSLLHTILATVGHEVFEARNGAAALRLLEEQAVELIFCDMLMPGMDGLETIRRLHQVLPTARIVAMSGGGRTGEGGLDSALRLGAAATLDKPFTVEQVLAAAEAVAEEQGRNAIDGPGTLAPHAPEGRA
jgi:CheY-like chemotaxis protein